MIRNNVAFCPCCYHVMLWLRSGNFYYCNCYGWFAAPLKMKLDYRRECEKYDYRSPESGVKRGK